MTNPEILPDGGKVPHVPDPTKRPEVEYIPLRAPAPSLVDGPTPAYDADCDECDEEALNRCETCGAYLDGLHEYGCIYHPQKENHDF